MKNRNIVLIGFMGAGKSMVSNKLANILARKAVSTDVLIEQKEERSIAKIFQDSGESYFRDVERKIVHEVSAQEGLIIDCGGGVVLDPENVRNLRKKGYLIYLRTSPEVIYERVKHKRHRPLLNVDDPKTKIKELLQARESYYKQADLTVNTDAKTVGQVCREIIENLEKDNF